MSPATPALQVDSLLLSHWGSPYTTSRYKMGFSGGASGKEPTCQYRRRKRCRFDPWVRKIPRRGNGNPLQYACLKNSMSRGDWWATVHGLAKSWTWPSSTHTHTHTHIHTHTQCMDWCWRTHTMHACPWIVFLARFLRVEFLGSDGPFPFCTVSTSFNPKWQYFC